MEPLVILLIVLTIVTLVGHGIWVFLRFLFRAAFGEPAANPDRRCVYCNRPTPVNHPRCIWCQRSLSDDTALELADVNASQRVLRRLHKAGLITGERHDELVGRLEEYRAQLVPPPPVAAPLPATPPQPAPRPEPPPVPVVVAALPEPKVPEPVAVVAPVTPKPALPPPPAVPRKSLPEMLREFMEPHNIRWGELIGGLLFIVGTAALVITQWETLERFRYFRFLALAATNLGVFAVGLYAQHRWHLPSTSRVLLTLATLLVPLDFLAMAGLAKDDPPLVSLGIDAVSLLTFGVLVALAGKTLVPGGRRWQVTGVMGLSLMVLLVARWASPACAGWALTAAGCAGAAIFAVGTGGYLHAATRGIAKGRGQAPISTVRVAHQATLEGVEKGASPLRLSPARAAGVFELVASGGFALAVVLGLLAYRGLEPGALHVVLDQLSLPLVLASVPPLVAGLTIARHMANRARLEPYRTGGNWLALASGILMLVALGLAWPWPGLMMPVGLLAALTLASAALAFRMPALHAGAIATAAIAYLMGFYWLIGATAGVERADMGHQLLRLLASAKTGTALVGLSVALSGLAYLFSRLARTADSLAYAAGAGLLALASLVSVSLAWPPDPWRAAIVCAVYAAASLVLCVHFRRPGLTYVGLGLTLAAVGWVLWARIGAIDIQWSAAYAGCALAMSIGAATLRRGTKWRIQPTGIWSPTDLATAYRGPLAQMADFVASGALVLGLGMAWLDQAQIDRNLMPPLAVIALVGHGLLSAWYRRQSARTVLASAVLLAGLVHTFVLNYPSLVRHPWQVALLAHAGLAVFGAGLVTWALSAATAGRRRLAGRLFVEPLCDTGIASSVAGLGLLVGIANRPASLAACFAVLAAIWIVLAVMRRSSRWMALHQIALAAAAGFGTYAWYRELPLENWVATHFHVAHAVGVALSLLALAWVMLRMAVRGQRLPGSLLQPAWPMPDQLLKHGLVVAQLAYLAHSSAMGNLLPGAWAVWGLLVAVLVLSLWERWAEAELADSLLLAVSLAWLVAGPVGRDPANRVAWSWALATCCLAISAASWARRPIEHACRAAKMRLDLGPAARYVALAVWLAFAWLVVQAVPSLPVTLAVGPSTSTLAQCLVGLRPVVLYLVPLGLLAAALVGNALRERSAGHLFLAGLLVDWMVVLGQLVAYGGIPQGEARAVALLQGPTIAAAVWSIAWLTASPWLTWLRVRSSPVADQVFRVQTGLACLGNVPLWLLGVSGVILVGSDASTTAAAVGSPLGWAAFGLALVAGAAQHAVAGRWISPHAVAVTGMAAVGMIACTIQGLWPEAEWGYRALMLGWAGYGWLIALGSWWTVDRLTLPGVKGSPETLIRATSTWVRAACLAAVLLALRAAAFYDQQLWAAGAIALAAAAGATMAVARRREPWALAASLGVNVAASLVAWHAHSHLEFAQWSIFLVQANAVASALSALLWMTVRQRIYVPQELRLRGSPLLAFQVLLPVVANLWLVGQFLFDMALDMRLARLVAPQLSQPVGWAALAVTAAAVSWYLAHVAPARVFEVVGGLVLGLTALATAASFRGIGLGAFGPVYALQILLAWAALLLAGLGQFGRPRWFSPADVRSWATFVGLLAIGYTLRWFAADPAQPWIGCWATLGVAATFGLMACWHQRPGYVWSAAGLANVATTLGWIAWGPWTMAGLIDANVAALASGAAAWLLVELTTGRVPTLTVAGERWPYAHLALRAAMGLLVITIGLSLVVQISQSDDALLMAGFRMSEPVHAAALALVTVAVGVALWDRSARFALGGVYAAGVAALGLALAGRGLAWPAIALHVAPALALFTLVAAAAAGTLPRLAGLARGLAIPADAERWTTTWLSPAQALFGATAAAWSVWVAMDPRFDAVTLAWLGGLPARMAGPLAAALLVPMAAAMARLSGRRRLSFLSSAEDREGWQELALIGAALASACLAWAWLAADGSPWLPRTAVLVTVLAANVLLCGYLLPAAFSATSDWRPVMDRVAGWLLLAAGPAIGILLGLEIHRYPPDAAVWNWFIIVGPAGAMAVLAAACIGFALRRGGDPLRLGAYVGGYVYAAEILVALIGLHVRLTRPELFHLGILQRYGLLLVMALTFGLAGLAELFDRRRLAVLSRPLQRTALVLPLLPTIAFWLLTPQPAAVWFLIGAFYGLMAAMRRSALLGVLAGVAANVGLWVFWHRLDLGILVHPQLWLIPPALAALLAQYFSRGRLRAEQASALRYVSLGVIYVSSSADMFIAGIGNSVLLPLVLLSLSVLGVLAGMALRIRSFLYLGVTFLLVVIAALLKHVTIDLHQTWVLWLSVGTLGAAILALFAVFEKRRTNLLGTMERFRTWQR
jgi:hypothetical protein